MSFHKFNKTITFLIRAELWQNFKFLKNNAVTLDRKLYYYIERVKEKISEKSIRLSRDPSTSYIRKRLETGL